MRSSLLFLLLALTFSANAQNKGADSLLTISRTQYSIGYPRSWSVDTSKTMGMDLLIRSPKSDSLDIFNENMNVFVQGLQGQGYYLSKMGKESEAQIRNMITDVEILESSLDSSAAEPYYTLRYNGRFGKYIVTATQRYYLKNEVGYALTFTMIKGKESEYAAIARQMFDSFRLR